MPTTDAVDVDDATDPAADVGLQVGRPAVRPVEEASPAEPIPVVAGPARGGRGPPC